MDLTVSLPSPSSLTQVYKPTQNHPSQPCAMPVSNQLILHMLTPPFKFQNHLHLQVSLRKQSQSLSIGQKMPTHFLLFLHHLHSHVNRAIFLFYVRLHLLLFHHFNIDLNVLPIVLVLIIVPILILIPFIHLTVTHLNLIPKHVLILTGNLTPGFLISAALSRLWDGSVPLDTISSFFVIIFLLCSVLICFLCLHFLRYPNFLVLHFLFLSLFFS